VVTAISLGQVDANPSSAAAEQVEDLDVFMSYSHLDEELADEIYELLQRKVPATCGKVRSGRRRRARQRERRNERDCAGYARAHFHMRDLYVQRRGVRPTPSSLLI
jgi:hypothetical protein